MIDKEELLFAVDENNNPIEPVKRYRAHSEGIWHRNAHIWVINSKKDVLCNKRSMQKEHNPGKWEAFFGGHVVAGSSPIQGALQELKEELGLKAKESDLELYKIIKQYFEDKNKEYIYVYIYFWDGNMDELEFEKDEIDEIKWFSLDEIKESQANKDPSWTWITYLHIPELLGYLSNLKQ